MSERESDCTKLSQQLPQLLDGSIDAVSRADLERHLESCTQCRQELLETEVAGAVYGQHPSAEKLLDWVSGASLTHDERNLIASHIEKCPDCSEQIDWLRHGLATLQSGDRDRSTAQEASEPSESAHVPSRSSSAWLRPLAWAAVILLVVSSSFGWWSWQRVRQAQGQVQGLTAEVAQLRTQRDQLADQSAADRMRAQELEETNRALGRPRLNVLAVDVLPQNRTLRSGEASSINRMAIPAWAQEVAFILAVSGRSSSAAYEVELLDAREAVLWKADGLRRNPSGDYTVSFPAGFLQPGDYTLRVFPSPKAQRPPTETYRIRIESSRRP